jgi:hypothetical protein
VQSAPISLLIAIKDHPGRNPQTLLFDVKMTLGGFSST